MSMNRKIPFGAAILTSAAMTVTPLAAGPPAHADELAYIVNVTVRPGYNFASAAQAVDYGRGLCQKIADGEGYSQLIGDVKSDFGTADEYQASYLISQASQELCPNLIWQLRNSAAHYQPPAPAEPLFPQCPPGMAYWPACP
jgi:hypothetical protein